jgi:uncharacterized protein (DUF2384 family)
MTKPEANKEGTKIIINLPVRDLKRSMDFLVSKQKAHVKKKGEKTTTWQRHPSG